MEKQTDMNSRTLYEQVYDDIGIGISWISENVDLLKRLLGCVRHGDVKTMRTLTGINPGSLEAQFATNPMRHTRNLVIGLLYMLGITAMESGAPSALCVRIMESYAQRTEQAETTGQLYAIADEAKLEFCRQSERYRMPGINDYRIRDAIIYIDEHISEKICIRDAAEKVGLSEAYFSRFFHEATGKTVTEYIQFAKIRQAKELLAYTDETLAEIANYLAFSSQNYFQKIFKKVEGCTPGDYRKMHRHRAF